MNGLLDDDGGRASSRRRRARLQALADACALQPLGVLAAAGLLGCSHTTARNYLQMLLDAGIIVRCREPAPAGVDKARYRLAASAATVAAGAVRRDALVSALFGTAACLN